MKKYELTEQTIEHDGRTLYQIRALRSFAKIKEGELGGYIEKEENLSHDGDAWIADMAMVYSDAKVYNDAQIYGNARVSEYAEVYGLARVFDYGLVSDCAQIYGNAQIFGKAKIFGQTKVFGNAQIFDDAEICGESYYSSNFEMAQALYEDAGDWSRSFDFNHIEFWIEISGHVKIFDQAKVNGEAIITGNACIFDNARILAEKRMYISGNTHIFGQDQGFNPIDISDFRVGDKVIVDGKYTGQITFITDTYFELEFGDETIRHYIEPEYHREDKATILFAQDGGRYTGPIVRMTKNYSVQDIGNNTLVMHKKEKLGLLPRTIDYQSENLLYGGNAWRDEEANVSGHVLVSKRLDEGAIQLAISDRR